jgi:undecaprenyl diphosphate synthase
MDGNGRWARSRALPRHAGHRAGVKAVRNVVERAAASGIRFLTLFAFSSENWGRPQDEVSRLMKLFLEALQREVDSLHRNNVRLQFIGARNELHIDLVKKIEAGEALTAKNDGLTLNVAVAYGGRWDIVNAAREIAREVHAGQLKPADVDEASFAARLALRAMPDPDLLIRTGGEHRISNFLLWHLAYAELWFSDCLWPDFGSAELDHALSEFASRQRRFGYTGEQVGTA